MKTYQIISVSSLVLSVVLFVSFLLNGESPLFLTGLVVLCIGAVTLLVGDSGGGVFSFSFRGREISVVPVKLTPFQVLTVYVDNGSYVWGRSLLSCNLAYTDSGARCIEMCLLFKYFYSPAVSIYWYIGRINIGTHTWNLPSWVTTLRFMMNKDTFRLKVHLPLNQMTLVTGSKNGVIYREVNLPAWFCTTILVLKGKFSVKPYWGLNEINITMGYTYKTVKLPSWVSMVYFNSKDKGSMLFEGIVPDFKSIVDTKYVSVEWYYHMQKVVIYIGKENVRKVRIPVPLP